MTDIRARDALAGREPYLCRHCGESFKLKLRPRVISFVEPGAVVVECPHCTFETAHHEPYDDRLLTPDEARVADADWFLARERARRDDSDTEPET